MSLARFLLVPDFLLKNKTKVPNGIVDDLCFSMAFRFCGCCIFFPWVKGAILYNSLVEKK